MVKPLFAKECYKCPGALLLFSCLSKSNRGEGGSSWNAEDDRNAPSRPRRDWPPHLPSGAQLACLGTGKKERKAKKKKKKKLGQEVASKVEGSTSPRRTNVNVPGRVEQRCGHLFRRIRGLSSCGARAGTRRSRSSSEGSKMHPDNARADGCPDQGSRLEIEKP